MKTVYKKDKARLDVVTTENYDILYFNGKILGAIDYDFGYDSETAREILHKIFKEAEK